MKLLKKVISFTLCAGLLLSLGACTDTTPDSQSNETTGTSQETIDPNAPLSDGKTLKLLAITSSFGLNTTQLLYDVAVAEGCTDVVVGRLYGSGCTLEKHVEYGLKDEDWDIIFIQQSAAKAGIIKCYGDKKLY